MLPGAEAAGAAAGGGTATAASASAGRSSTVVMPRISGASGHPRERDIVHLADGLATALQRVTELERTARADAESWARGFVRKGFVRKV